MNGHIRQACWLLRRNLLLTVLAAALVASASCSFQDRASEVQPATTAPATTSITQTTGTPQNADAAGTGYPGLTGHMTGADPTIWLPLNTGQGGHGDPYTPPTPPDLVRATAVFVAAPFVYVGLADRVVIYDVTDPARVRFVGRTAKLNTEVNDIVVQRGFLYAAVARWQPPSSTGGVNVAAPDQAAAVLAFDLGEPSAPALTGWVASPGGCEDLALDGSRLYVAAGSDGLRVLDLGDPAHPKASGGVPIGDASAVAVAKGVVYVGQQGDVSLADDTATTTDAGGVDTPATGNDTPPRLYLIDAAVAAANGSPILGQVDLDQPPTKLAVAGSNVYLAVPTGLEIIDVSNPPRPVKIADVPVFNEPTDVFATSMDVYLVQRSSDDLAPTLGLQVIAVDTPTDPQIVGEATMWRGASAVAVAGTHAYIAAGDGLRVYDIARPWEPALVAGSDQTRSWWADVAVAGHHAYVADWFGGLRVLDVANPAAPVEVGHVAASSDRLVNAMLDVAGQHVFMGAGSRLSVYDVSDPSAPTVVGVSDDLYWMEPFVKAVLVVGAYAYVSTGLSGVIIVDVSDVTTPRQVGRLDVSEVGSIAVDGRYAFVPCDAGLVVFDVSDPARPSEVARTGPNGLRHAALMGNRLCASQVGVGLVVFDITDRAHPVQVSTSGGPTVVNDLTAGPGSLFVATDGQGVQVLDLDAVTTAAVRVVDEPGYALAIAVDGVHAYIVYGDGYQIFDVANPRAPTQLYGHEGPG